MKNFITLGFKGFDSGMALFIVVPNNRSLVGYVDIALKLLGIPKDESVIESRGEDIPLIVEEFSKYGKNVIGLTGSDLFKEYKLSKELSKEVTKLSILKTIPWSDKKALFGKPVLCILGPKGKKIDDLPKNLRVCINSKYGNLANKYLNQLEIRDYNFEKIYLSGSTEAAYTSGLSDLVIDIVYTGASMMDAGLEVYDKIYESDFVVISTKNSEEVFRHPSSLVNFPERRRDD